MPGFCSPPTTRRCSSKLLASLVTLLCFACAGKPVETTVRQVRFEPPDAGAAAPAVPSRMFIRSAWVELLASDPAAAAESLKETVHSLGGYVATFSTESRPRGPKAHVTLRVPADHLDEALGRLREIADRVTREEVTTEDVTDRYVDLEARIRALAAAEAELLEVLGQAREEGQQAGDIVAIYKHLTEIRGSLEELQGRRNLLENQVEFATVYANIAPSDGGLSVLSGRWEPARTARAAVGTLVSSLRFLGDAAIYCAIVVVPFVLLFALPVLAIALVVRRLRRPAR